MTNEQAIWKARTVINGVVSLDQWTEQALVDAISSALIEASQPHMDGEATRHDNHS